MILTSPAWLLGLLLLPVLYWMHRLAGRGRRVRVSSLALWPDRPPAALDSAEAPRRMDATWLRRAAITTLLALALAGPSMPVAAPPLVVWVDGSPSLRTTEGGSSRLAAALSLLAERVRARGGGPVEFRSLSDPAFVARRSAPFVGLDVPAGPPSLPDARDLDPTAEHWALTDGVQPAIGAWIDAAPIRSVIRSGENTENAGVLALAVRPSLHAPSEAEVEVAVRNAGRSSVHRALVLADRHGERLRLELDLAPGESRRIRATLPPPELPLEARLSPADALALDDVLVLDGPAPYLTPVAIDRPCGHDLRAALLAHPALRAASPADRTAVRVLCSDAVASGPALRVVAAGAPRHFQAPAWAPAMARFRPPALGAQITARGALATASGDEVLLGTATDALVVARRGPDRRLETTLDLADPALAGTAAYPALVAVLVDATLGRRLLAEFPATDREPGTIDVAPRRTWPATRAGVPVPRGAVRSLAPLGLAVALLLLLLDAGLALSSMRRDRRYDAGEAP